MGSTSGGGAQGLTLSTSEPHSGVHQPRVGGGATLGTTPTTASATLGSPLTNYSMAGGGWDDTFTEEVLFGAMGAGFPEEDTYGESEATGTSFAGSRPKLAGRHSHSHADDDDDDDDEDRTAGDGGGAGADKAKRDAVTAQILNAHHNNSNPNSKNHRSNKPHSIAAAQLSRELAVLEASLPSYRKGIQAIGGGAVNLKSIIKQKREGTYRYVVGSDLLTKLEAAHQLFFMNQHEYAPQPYAIPFYAEHIRPMLLTVVPSILASLYLGLRLNEEAPLYYAIVHTHQQLLQLASMFMMRYDALITAVEETLQQHLLDSGSYDLPPPFRAAFLLHALVV